MLRKLVCFIDAMDEGLYGNSAELNFPTPIFLGLPIFAAVVAVSGVLAKRGSRAQWIPVAGCAVQVAVVAASLLYIYAG